LAASARARDHHVD